MNIEEGKSIQDGIPTPNNPVEIKSINIFKVNDIQYRDNIPSNRLIGITKEQYCEYEQLQQENQQLKSMICPIYEKCQKGECDCTHEEYDSMCEKNMEMSVELNKYKSIVEEAIEYIKHSWWLRFDQVYNTSKDLKGWEVEQLFEILNKIKELEEGGKND